VGEAGVTPLSRERIDECKWAEMHVDNDTLDKALWCVLGLVLVAAVLGAWRW
jgi:hypothetical protein